MTELEEYLEQHRNSLIALYGLGTETERFLANWGNKLSVIGLLDGFRENGEMYEYPILSMQEAINKGVELIIVIARPGSCKAIEKKIGNICKANKIALLDVRGKNLLIKNAITYDFRHERGETKQSFWTKVDKADVVSFDLFDTLITRKVLFYTDIFELMDAKLKNQGIYIPDFVQLRLASEKDLSKRKAVTLENIYEEVLRKAGGSFVKASELVEMEWEIDFSTMLLRNEVYHIFLDVVSKGKKVIITTDSYYCRNLIQKILDRFEIKGYKHLFISCEYGTSKTQSLFDKVLLKIGNAAVLHIGDDEAADIQSARARKFDTYRVYSGKELFDALGGLGIEVYLSNLSDRLKAGLFISRLFNNPFWFDTKECKIIFSDAYDVSYLLCAPLITDFVLWLKEKIQEQGIKQILFCARDGYLIGKLYRKIDEKTKSLYFLTSRTAAVRAGMKSDEDISYIDSMKYFGTEEESLFVRFGIHTVNEGECNRNELILHKADIRRQNYKKYIEKLDIQNMEIALFDFVAKGTTQFYLQRLFSEHLKGFYFLQLEPEFMADKGLDIEPFYSNDEKNTSVIFDNYYILETLLTSPYPATEEFGKDGTPIYAEETRNEQNIKCLNKMQQGISDYFEDYIRLLPENKREKNKKLDEAFLSLVNVLQITDEAFLSFIVEDMFFGRMTDIKDVIG